MEIITLSGRNNQYHFHPNEKKSVLRANGKFSIIYKGKRDSDGLDVVIKMLHPRLVKNNNQRKLFVREYLNSIKDEIFAEVFDICQVGKNLYIIREFVNGVNLDDCKKNKDIDSAIKKESKEKVVLKIIDAFIQMHQHKIIHGDIKPSNVLLFLKSDGSIGVKLIDLGLAMPLDHKMHRDPQNALPFSLMYSAPELMLNYPEVINATTDVFSLALTIYEFLTGQKPLDVSHPALMMSLQLNEPLQAHRKLNSSTLDVLNKASFKYKFQQPIQNYPVLTVRKNLRAAVMCRYQTMEEFKEELEKAFEKKDGILKKLFK